MLLSNGEPGNTEYMPYVPPSLSASSAAASVAAIVAHDFCAAVESLMTSAGQTSQRPPVFDLLSDRLKG